jgi:hypothetical protein
MARDEPRIRNPVAERTCVYCERVYQFPAGARECEGWRLDRAPTFKPGDELVLDAEVFAEKFPKLDPASNLFAVAGSLFADGWDPRRQCQVTLRTMNCFIQSDSKNRRHFYVVRVRLIGEASLKEDRLVFVRARDLRLATTPISEPEPTSTPVADKQ